MLYLGYQNTEIPSFFPITLQCNALTSGQFKKCDVLCLTSPPGVGTRYLSFYLSMLVLPELPLVLKSISNQEIMSGEFLPGNGVGRGKFLSCGIHLYSLGGGWWWLQETQETLQLLVWGPVSWEGLLLYKY